MSDLCFQTISGVLTPVENGIPLCGAAFLEEAQLWTEKHDLSAPKVVILGLGAGHHVRAWLAANPDSHALVIDPRPGLITPFFASNRDLRDRVDVLTIESLDGLMNHEILRTVAEDLPPVLAFRPCFGGQSELFESLFATLTGRNVWGLRYFLRFCGLDDVDALEFSEDGRLLTIRDLGLVIDSSHAGHPKAPVVRVLRELIV